jgi:hypothetical protein
VARGVPPNSSAGVAARYGVWGCSGTGPPSREKLSAGPLKKSTPPPHAHTPPPTGPMNLHPPGGLCNIFDGPGGNFLRLLTAVLTMHGSPSVLERRKTSKGLNATPRWPRAGPMGLLGSQNCSACGAPHGPPTATIVSSAAMKRYSLVDDPLRFKRATPSR